MQALVIALCILLVANALLLVGLMLRRRHERSLVKRTAQKTAEEVAARLGRPT